MEIEEKDLNVLVSYFKENPNLKLLNFIKTITARTGNLLKSFGPGILSDIGVSFKKQLDNLEDTWFSQETMLKIKCQKEQAIECEEVKTDEALWKVKFAESIKDDLTELDDQKRTKIFELLKKASLSENPEIAGYPLNGGFWRYEVGDVEEIPRGSNCFEFMLINIHRITCKFDFKNSIILVLRISPPYKNRELVIVSGK